MIFYNVLMGLIAMMASYIQAAPRQDYTQYLPRSTNVALFGAKNRFPSYLLLLSIANKYHSLPVPQKLSALAALLQFGANYHFVTTFETYGKIQQGVLNGDLNSTFHWRLHATTPRYSQYDCYPSKTGYS